MRSLNDIITVINHPSTFLKSDIYKSAILELYTFVPLKDLPERFVSHLTEEQKADWNPNFDEDIASLPEDIDDELSFLRRMLSEHLIREAASRTPRLLALIWITGKGVEDLDKTLYKIIVSSKSMETLERNLTKLYIRIEKYIKN